MPSLVFLAGPIAGRRYKLGDGEYVIGRRSDCQIFVPDMRVSRQHARLWRDGDGWSLEDLGSNNGTYINGVRVQGASQIRHDDEIMIANNKIRVEAQDHPSEQLRLEGQAVTIVDVGGQALIKSRDDSGAGRAALVSSGLISVADQKAVRLIERKLDALTSVLHAIAATDSEEALIEKIVEALLDLFPQAEDVGVLVEDSRSGELRIQCQRHRQRPQSDPVETDPRRTFGGELRVPGTIIQHVVSDRRGVLLGETSEGDEAVGTRMGAPLIYHGAHYGVVYVESLKQSFRQEDVDLLQAVATQAGLAMHATRVAGQLARREQLERDLRVARQIQRSLLPANVPQVVGLDFAVHYEPAYQIGGDFYDFICHDPAHLGLVVGDVAGKAISAALYMARVTSELRSRAAIARTPARLLRRVNQEIAQLGDDGMF
ncbi:MAG TPA: FHA domain-containing protein, partial [Kofleriaceae bacterium]